MSPGLFILTFAAVEAALALAGALAVRCRQVRQQRVEGRHRERIRELEAEVRRLQDIVAHDRALERQRQLHSDPRWQQFRTFGIEEGI